MRKYATKIWFENVELDLWNLNNKINFPKVSSNSQNKLREDIKHKKKLKKPFLSAEKTSKIYQIKKDEFSKVITNVMTLTYKKILDKISNKINADGKRIIGNKQVVN